VEAGASLTISGTASVAAGAVTGGTGGNPGQAFANGIYLQGNNTLTFDPAGLQTITGVIGDDSGSAAAADYNQNVTIFSQFFPQGEIILGNYSEGSIGIVVNGPGTLQLEATNTYQGTSTIDSGTLQLSALGAAGSGAIAFAANANAKLTIDNVALVNGTFNGNTIKGFAVGDTIDLSGATFSSAANPPTLLAGNQLQFTENGTTYQVQFDSSQSFSNEVFKLARDGTGTDIELAGPPKIGSTGNTVRFYQSQATATTLDGGITVTDPAGADITSATVTINSPLAGDTLSILADLTGTGISLTGNNSTTLSLSGDASASLYQSVLSDVTYSFSGDPSNSGADKTRTVTWSMADADGLTSVSGTTTTLDVYMTPVLGGSPATTPAISSTSGAEVADSDLTVTDHNTFGTAPAATVSISGAPLAMSFSFRPPI
jgi:autotransporter-associated beta strand protein